MNKYRQKFKTTEQIHFSKRLSFLVSANIPLLKCLKIMAANCSSKNEEKILATLAKKIEGGAGLSRTLKESGVLNAMGLYLVEVGERSGALATNLQLVAEELEKSRKLKQKIQGALFYPLIISIVSVAMSVFLITFVFPKILPILSGISGKLPLPTEILIMVSSVLRRFGFYILGAAAIFSGGAYLLFIFLPPVRIFWERLLLATPYLNRFIIYYELSNFSRILGLLLKNNFILTTSLVMISENSSHHIYRRNYTQIHSSITEGKNLTSSLKESNSKLFPNLFCQMIEAGEESGELSGTFLYLSTLYSNELDQKAQTLSVLIEPALMIFMGFIVGMVALSIVLPIYQITSTLQH